VRTRELLVYLLVHSEGRTKEQVGIAFWPEASSAQLRNNFHVTLHRLRKALRNPEWVLLANDRYRIDPAIVREFDVAEFEREVVAGRRTLRLSRDGADAALERALTRFRGDFLDGESVGDWHNELRDRMQRLYVDACLDLGIAYVDAENWAKAAETYRRILARDEIHEEAARALMTCLVRLGGRTQSLRLYQRLSVRLRQELDAEPDEETTALYERVQRGEGF
jgi:DNA-binding SARP family transcriptional activator